MPNLLAYGTGGVAFQRVEANLTCSFAGPWCFPPVATDIRNETQADTLKGWTVGGGLEWLAHGHWLVRGEYRYADLGNFSPIFYEGTPDVVFTDIHVVTQVLTFGVSAWVSLRISVATGGKHHGPAKLQVRFASTRWKATPAVP